MLASIILSLMAVQFGITAPSSSSISSSSSFSSSNCVGSSCKNASPSSATSENTASIPSPYPCFGANCASTYLGSPCVGIGCSYPTVMSNPCYGPNCDSSASASSLCIGPNCGSTIYGAQLNPCTGLGCLFPSTYQASTPCIGPNCSPSTSQAALQFLACLDGNCGSTLCNDPSCIPTLQPVYVSNSNPYYGTVGTAYSPCYGSNCASGTGFALYPANTFMNPCIPGTPGCNSIGYSSKTPLLTVLRGALLNRRK